jgi:hypothetical protein
MNSPFLEPRAFWIWNRKQTAQKTLLKLVVGVTGFEPATSTSQTIAFVTSTYG